MFFLGAIYVYSLDSLETSRKRQFVRELNSNSTIFGENNQYDETKNFLYTLLKDEKKIIRWDLKTGEHIEVVSRKVGNGPILEDPESFVLSEDKKTLYICDSGNNFNKYMFSSGFIIKVDLETRVRSYALAPEVGDILFLPNFMSIIPNSNKAYVYCYSTDTLYLADLKKGEKSPLFYEFLAFGKGTLKISSIKATSNRNLFVMFKNHDWFMRYSYHLNRRIPHSLKDKNHVIRNARMVSDNFNSLFIDIYDLDTNSFAKVSLGIDKIISFPMRSTASLDN